MNAPNRESVLGSRCDMGSEDETLDLLDDHQLHGRMLLKQTLQVVQCLRCCLAFGIAL